MGEVKDVVCVGFVTTDIMANGVEKIEFGGVTNIVDSVSMHVGGDALNEAFTLAHLGHKTGLMSLVGRDAQGEFVAAECRKAGVDTEGVAISDTYPTSTSVVLVGRDGQRSFISQHGGCADEYSLDDIDLSLIQPGTRVVSIGSIFCSKSFDQGALRAVLEKAKSVGAVTIADFVPNRNEANIEELKEVLPLLDYVVPSIEEAVLYTGLSDLDEIAEAFLKAGAGTVLIKMGKKGSFAKNEHERLELPIYDAKVIDTTGAGDNFVAGFISGLLRDYSLEGCLQVGTATAAVSVGSIGATTGVRSFAQVQEVIHKNS